MDIISVRKIKDGLYQLSENISSEAAVQMYLVVGVEKAALVDTGYGLSGDLDQVVKSITDKPIICLVTHCDPDHAGSAALFKDIHMSERDQVLMDNGSLAKIGRFGTAQAMADDEERVKYFKEHMVKAESFEYKDISDGEVFDLGDRTLIAISFPGHTEGSMCFWNKEENYCLVGDAVANVSSPVLFFKKCLPLEDYKQNLIAFIGKVGEDCALYSGHNSDALPGDLIPEILTLCDEVLDGKTDNDVPYAPPFMKEAPEGAGVKEKIKSKLISEVVSRKELGDAVPMEHKGIKASIKYNARKIHRSDVPEKNQTHREKIKSNFEALKEKHS